MKYYDYQFFSSSLRASPRTADHLIYEDDIYFLQQLYDRWVLVLRPNNSDWEDYSWFINEEEMTLRGNGNSTTEILDLMDGLYASINAEADHSLTFAELLAGDTETAGRDTTARYELITDIYLSYYSAKIKWTGPTGTTNRANFITSFVADFMALGEDKSKTEPNSLRSIMRVIEGVVVYYPRAEHPDD